MLQMSSTRQWRPKIAKLLKESTDTKTLYYATIAASNMIMMNKEDGGVFSDGHLPPTLGYLVATLALSAVDNQAVLAALMEAVEKEDTPQSYAYAFLAASAIPEVDLSALFESIEDIVAQADETSSTLYVRLTSRVTL